MMKLTTLTMMIILSAMLILFTIITVATTIIFRMISNDDHIFNNCKANLTLFAAPRMSWMISPVFALKSPAASF